MYNMPNKIETLEESMKKCGLVREGEDKLALTLESITEKKDAFKDKLEEGLRLKKTKRQSASQRAAGRSKYRKTKSKVKKQRKMRNRKASVKRKKKALKRLKKGRSAGFRKKFVLENREIYENFLSHIGETEKTLTESKMSIEELGTQLESYLELNESLIKDTKELESFLESAIMENEELFFRVTFLDEIIDDVMDKFPSWDIEDLNGQDINVYGSSAIDLDKKVAQVEEHFGDQIGRLRRVYQEPKSMSEATGDNMLDGYIEAALWSSTHPDKDENLDANYGFVDLTDKWVALAKSDIEEFKNKAGDLYDKALEHMKPEQAGHDFWLSREGHGAGFWDEGLGELGDKLDEIAKSFGGGYDDLIQFGIDWDDDYEAESGDLEESASEKWVIEDWAGNKVFSSEVSDFPNFDAAEAWLSEKLGDDYDEDRGEYEIVQMEESTEAVIGGEEDPALDEFKEDDEEPKDDDKDSEDDSDDDQENCICPGDDWEIEEGVSSVHGLQKLHEDATYVLDALRQNEISPNEANNLVGQIVSYLGGSLKTYLDVAKDAAKQEAVGQGTPKSEQGKPTDTDSNHKAVGKDANLDQVPKVPAADKHTNKQVGKDSNLAQTNGKVDSKKNDQSVVGVDDMLKSFGVKDSAFDKDGKGIPVGTGK